MDEVAKTEKIRGPEFMDKYFSGKVLDIGCGDDLVVPDEDLYEQGVWPSLFNRDHSATFRLNKTESWSPVSYDLGELCSALPCAEVISLEQQDIGYDHSLKSHGLGRRGKFFMRLNRSIIKRLNRKQELLAKLGLNSQSLKYKVNLISVKFGYLIDQTLEDAVAQIQIVLRKKMKVKLFLKHGFQK